MGWPGPETSRQFMVWLVWQDMEFKEPSLTDYYLMQLTAEVMRSRVAKPGQVKSEWFKIQFKEPDQEEVEKRKEAVRKHNVGLLDRPEDPGDSSHTKGPQISTDYEKNLLALTKARWLGWMTAPVTVVEVKRGEEANRT